MGNLLAAATASGAFGAALTQVQADVMESIARGLPIGLAIMGTIPAVTTDAKAFKRFVK